MDFNKVMRKVFMFMMCNNMFKSENLMFTSLKSVCHVCKNAYRLSDEQIKEGIMSFYKEYNMGCREPMSYSYIQKILIPAILNHQTIDIKLADIILEGIDF